MIERLHMKLIPGMWFAVLMHPFSSIKKWFLTEEKYFLKNQRI